MNIAFLFFRPLDPHIGGVERVTDILTKELKSRGYNIEYLVFRKIENIGDLATDIYYFPDPEIYVTEKNKKFYTRFIKEHKIDICVLQEPRFCAGIFDLFPTQNCKLVSVYHGGPAGDLCFYWKNSLRKHTSNFDYCLKYIPRLFLRALYKIRLNKVLSNSINEAIRKSDAIVYLSDKFIPDFKLVHIIPDNRKFYYIGNPSTYIIPDEIPKKEKIILFVGRMVPHKNPDLIIRIWNKIAPDYPDWKILFIGEGPMIDYCKNQFNCSNNIEFLGQRDPEDFYKKASILCMASNNEGWGMVLVEAMSMGCVPIVFESFRSINDIIEHNKNGILVKPFSRKLYRKGLRNLIDNDDFRRSLAENAMGKVKEFAPKIIVEKWIQLFEKVMSHEG